MKARIYTMLIFISLLILRGIFCYTMLSFSLTHKKCSYVKEKEKGEKPPRDRLKAIYKCDISNKHITCEVKKTKRRTADDMYRLWPLRAPTSW